MPTLPLTEPTGGSPADDPRHSAGQPVVVGRDTQLAQLRRWCAALPQGSRTLVLAAEAGGGKTTLVQALAQELTDTTVVVGECIPLGGEGLPFVPVSSLLRGLVARFGLDTVRQWAGPATAALGSLLPVLAPPEVEPDQTDRIRLFEAVGQVLEQAATEQPLLVIIEDLHWSDEATRDLIAFLARSLGPAPVGLLLTYRTDEVLRHHPLRPYLAELSRAAGVTRMELPRLDRAGVAGLLGQLFGEEPDPELVTSVYERTGGLPYFVAELACTVGIGCQDLPDDLRDTLMVRANGLSSQALHLVRVMSTAGSAMGDDLVTAVIGDDFDRATLDRLLREAVDAGILTADERGYGFRHALLREAVHADLLPGEHARVHARFARALLTHPHLAQNKLASELAHHWAAANEQQLAFDAALEAARTSVSPYEQLRMYERVLELWDQVVRTDPDLTRADVLEAAALACRRTSASDRGLPFIQAALADTDPVAAPLDAARRYVIKGALEGLLAEVGPRRDGREFHGAGDAASTVETAVRLAEPYPESIEYASALDAQATHLMLAGRYPEAAEVARRAEEVALRQGRDSLLASARITLGGCLVMTGDEDHGIAVARSGRLPSAASDWYVELRHYINVSDLLLVAGRRQESADLALAGIELAQRYGLGRAAGAMALGNAAEALIELGDLDRAGRLVAEGLALAPGGHHRLHLTLVQAWIQAWQGRFAEARRAIPRMEQERSPAGQLPQYQLWWRRAEAELALWRGEPSDAGRAWQAMEPMVDAIEVYGLPRGAVVLAVAARAATDPGAPPTAADRIRELVAVPRPGSRVAPVHLAIATAELEDTPDAWRGALSALETDGGPVPGIPYAQWRLAASQLASGDRAGISETLEDAATRAEAMGLAPLAERIAGVRRRAGLSVVQGRGGRAPAAVALTSREQEVLRLVSEGRSNAEIGRELFISAKTVSVHVSNVIAKLGATNRGDAAARARRGGLID